jgi:dethiobiotin synthetase
VPVLGVAFLGDAEAETERIITGMGGVRHLGRLPRLDPLSPNGLRQAFSEAFRVEDFLSGAV